MQNGLEITNCQIGGNVQLQGLAGSMDSFICASHVGGDVTIQQDAAREALVIGGSSDCYGGNSFGHDVTIQNNLGPVDFENNTVAHDLHVAGNQAGATVDGDQISHDMTVQTDLGGTDVSNDNIVHDATCQGNTPATTGSGNEVDGNDQGCFVGTQTQCTPGSGGGFCFAYGSSADGSTDGTVGSNDPSSGTETINISFNTQPLPCSNPNNGDTMVFNVSNAGSTQAGHLGRLWGRCRQCQCRLSEQQQPGDRLLRIADSVHVDGPWHAGPVRPEWAVLWSASDVCVRREREPDQRPMPRGFVFLLG